jgi:hypothetical protein
MMNLAILLWNGQVSGGVIGYGIEVGDWAQVYMGYFTVRCLMPRHAHIVVMVQSNGFWY